MYVFVLLLQQTFHLTHVTLKSLLFQYAEAMVKLFHYQFRPKLKRSQAPTAPEATPTPSKGCWRQGRRCGRRLLPGIILKNCLGKCGAVADGSCSS